VHLFELLSILTTLAALFSWVNHRYLRLPRTVGLMAITLLFSLGLVLLGHLGWTPEQQIERGVRGIDLDATLLHGMLGALLFAGALHVDLDDLMAQRGVVAVLATVSVLLSTFFVGLLIWIAAGWLGVDLALPLCFAFGALVSPTDPVAVLGILKQVRVPRSLEMKIAGESLFNDGVGVVVFLALLQWAAAGERLAASEVARLLLVESVGGVVFGLILGWGVYRMLRAVDQYQVEILMTLAVVTGGYALAETLSVSGPLAMVVCGLFIGNRGRRLGMSERTRERLDAFWELVDEFLNAILFVLIGLEVLVLRWTAAGLLAGAVAIPVVLISRWMAVGLPILVMRRWRRVSPHAVKVLTWVGLRGGISVALALSLPSGARDLLVSATYLVVCFSILVQGLTLAPLLQRLYPSSRSSD
jgi:CPA1 family monovalent cation:H+ antiporter